MIGVALITGATSGIGEALAHLLASKNIKLILSGRNLERLQKLAEETGAESLVVADLRTEEGVHKILEAVKTHLPDLLINNAGFGLYGEALSHPLEEEIAIAKVDALAPLTLTLETARLWIQNQKKGVILNVSSVAGEHPGPGMSIYAASKSFLSSFSSSLHDELKEKGVDILVSCPGMVTTNFAKRAAGKEVKVSGPVMSAEFAARQIWWQIEKRKEKHIFDWRYRWGTYLAKFLLPCSVVKRMIWKRIQERL